MEDLSAEYFAVTIQYLQEIKVLIVLGLATIWSAISIFIIRRFINF